MKYLPGLSRKELADILRSLSGDFESLADPARDDMVFIYKWEPPKWWREKEWHRTQGNELYQYGHDEYIEIAAALALAASELTRMDP